MKAFRHIFYLYLILTIILLKSTSAYSLNTIDKTKSITAEIDTSLITGEIECSYDVNNFGDLNINIPIKIYTGENDLNPNISINYNHNGTNGFLGHGWTLSGISVISRVNKSMYYDGKTESIKIDTCDAAFTLDGKRLVKISSSDNQIIFQPDNDYTKVIAKLTGNNITSFTAYYTDGRIAEYTNSGFTDYYITKCTDRLGNKITFTYESQGNLKMIKKISYGKRLQNYVEFEYKENPSCAYAHYTDGILFTNKKILSTISTYINSKPVRTYTLDYKTIHNNVIIEKINCTISGQKLNPLIFKYDNGESKESVSIGYERKFKQPIKNSVDNIYQTANLNQNGKSSLLYYTAKLPYGINSRLSHPANAFIINEYKSNDSIYLYNDLYVPNFSDIYNDILNNPWSNVTPPYINNYDIINPNSDYYKIKNVKRITTGDGFITILPIGKADGTNELLKINNIQSGDFDKLTFTAYGSNFTGKYKSDFYLSTLVKGNIVPKKFLSGDFNGDGKIEIFVITSIDEKLVNEFPYTGRYFLLNPYEKSILNDPNTNTNIVLNTASLISGATQEENNKIDVESDKLTTIDYNGDGKTDLLLINSTGIQVFTYNNDSRHFDLIASSSILNKKDVGSNVFGTGDFNNDGKTDLIISKSQSAAWNILCSRGDGTFDKKDINIEKKQKNTTYYIKDLNDDGIADIISGGLNKIKVFLVKNQKNPSDSNSFMLDTLTISANVVNAMTMIPYSEGKASFLRLNSTDVRTVTLSQDVNKDMLLTSMIKSNGEICEFEYAWKGSEKTEKKNNLMKGYSNRRVCSTIKSYFYKDEKNSLQTNMYEYSEPYTNLEGLGFLGFSKVKKKNMFLSNRTDTTGVVEKYIISTYDPTKMMALTKTESSNMQNVDYTYTMSTNDKKWSTINLTSITTSNNANGTQLKETFSYDNYGNVKNHNIDYGDGIEKQTLSKYKYIDDGIKYIVNVPYESEATNIRDDKSTSSTIEYEYNDNMLPVKKIVKRNGITENIEEYAYTTEHLIKEHTINPCGGTEKLTDKYEYNGIGLVTSHTNTYGKTTTFTYDDLNRLITSTDFKQHTSEYEYDVLGRLIRTTIPCATKYPLTTQKIIKTTNIEWADNNNAIYKITNTETGKPTNITYYNIYGEAVKSQTQDFDNSYITVDKEFDRSGRILCESFPYKNISYRWKNYAYDNADRVINMKITKLIDRLGPIKPINATGISIREETGQYENYTYDKLKTTIDNCGRITSNIKDVKGNTIQSTDANGATTYYEYDPEDRITKITTPGNNNEYTCTDISYDELGRKKEINDMVHGTTTYTYDGNGHTKTITDGKGHTTSYEYDDYGNITKKISSDVNTTYTYNTDNLISEIRNSNGHTKTYKYNDYLKISEIKSEIEDKSLTIKYTYDGNNISEIQYTTPTKSHNEIFYYRNGIKTCIVRNKEVYVKPFPPIDKAISIRPGILNDTVYILKATNQMGLPTEYNTGQIRHKREYDNEGRVKRITDYYKENVLQDFKYQYNLYGEMISRKDSLRDLSENFEYDNNGWLTNSASGQVSYDEKGNITDNLYAKNITYGSNNPYAITSANIENASNNYNNLTINYNSMNLPSEISTFKDDANTLISTSFDYDENGNRIKTCKTISKTISPSEGRTIINNNLSDKHIYRYYFDNKYEFVNDEASSKQYGLFYICGNAYTSDIVYKDSASTSTRYYILRDNIGSITKIIDSNGKTIEELSFDAWGNMRNPNTWQVYNAEDMPEELFINRGYTGHEYMGDYGLINMNARLYDPILGRFISPDPIFKLFDGNGLNPYAYANNNPMTYIDRDGKFPFLLIGMVALGGWLGGSIANKNLNPVKWNWSSPKTYFGTIFGGLTGGVSSYMIAGGSVGYSFIAATPFVSFGGTIYKNSSSDSWTVSPIYNTAGGYNYSEHASDDLVSDNVNKLKNSFIHLCEEYHEAKQDVTLGMAIDYSNYTVDGLNSSFEIIKSKNEKFLKAPKMLINTSKGLSNFLDTEGIIDGIGQDHGFGYNAQKNTVELISGSIGGYVGAIIGSAGGPVVGVVASYAMSYIFSEASGYLYDAIYKNNTIIYSYPSLPGIYQNDFNNHYYNFMGTY